MTHWKAQTYIAPGHVMVRELDGEAVLLDLNEEIYFGLDEVGTRLWTILSTSASVETALDTLEAEYDVSREVLENDVASLIRELVARGLLEPVGTA